MPALTCYEIQRASLLFCLLGASVIGGRYKQRDRKGKARYRKHSVRARLRACGYRVQKPVRAKAPYSLRRVGARHFARRLRDRFKRARQAARRSRSYGGRSVLFGRVVAGA